MRAAWLALGWLSLGACTAIRNEDLPPAAVPRDPDALLSRAVSLFKAKRCEECRAYCDAILKEHPDYTKAETARYLSAESLYQLGDFEAALAQYRRLVEDFPLTRAHVVVPDRLFTIGAALAANPKPLLGGILFDRRPAIDALGYLVVQYPSSPRVDEAWLLLGDQHRAEGEFDLAAEAYARLVSRCTESPLREEATYRIATTFAEKARGADYDQQPMVLAWAAAGRYLDEYGGGRFAIEARALRDEMTAGVRESERWIAEFYRGMAQDAGERIHRANAEIALVVGGGGDDEIVRESSIDLIRPRTERAPWEAEGGGVALRAFFAAWAAGAAAARARAR